MERASNDTRRRAGKARFERPAITGLGDFRVLTRDFGPFTPGDMPGPFTPPGQPPDHDPYS